MINTYLGQQIKTNFPYKPTFEQENVVKILADFLFCRKTESLFLLKGYAGTGKTSLIGALVKTLDQLEQKCILLAPTGRAAKVFSHYAGHPAYTIHKKIYRQKSFSNELDNFSMNDNLHQHTLFIVDEASMIANEGLAGSMFGTGRLLDDLIQYVYSGQGCRLMLIGDTAQLPPVGVKQVEVLNSAYQYGLIAMMCGLPLFGGAAMILAATGTLSLLELAAIPASPMMIFGALVMLIGVCGESGIAPFFASKAEMFRTPGSPFILIIHLSSLFIIVRFIEILLTIL